jgi:thiamine pyrophosphokinase
LKEIKFAGKFDSLICLDGALPQKEFYEKMSYIPVLAADGAAIQLINMGIEFKKVIGDFDTLEKKGYLEKVSNEKRIYMPDQEHNDFDKTLQYAESEGMKDILICGFHGGELEHTLNNWSVFRRYSKNMNLCIYENGRYALPLCENTSFTVKRNEMISLIPQPSALISTKGLRWNLRNEKIELGIREGARNVAIEGNVEINIHNGELLVFIDSRLPNAPVYI